MVKMSETIICQRFVQNTWKKDLCSNCFKSKEDHIVSEKKITYRWTSHVDNFPQHGILRRSEKSKPKVQNVSFPENETEIIGFGGEEYSSDDEFYPAFNEECPPDNDNDEENKEFRKLTQTNTDFNSVPANLRNDAPVVVTPMKTYSNLKLGTPQKDADGRRQTLQVTVEPFKNSVTVNGGGLANDRKVHLNKILLESTNGGGEQKTECEKESKINLSETPVICDINANCVNDVNVTNVNVNETINENVYLKLNGKETNGDCDEKLIKITNVLVNGSKREDSESNVAENMKNAKNKLEPLFKLATFENGAKRLSIYQSSPEEEKPPKDCNPIANLPLITSKELEIEIDRPGSREMVGEPDGKADSDDSADPLVTEEAKSEDPVYVNPQRSFLHGFLKEKPVPPSKPATLLNGTIKKVEKETKHCREGSDISVGIISQSSVPSTPKMQVANCNGTGSTKRQAPKPPSPTITPQTPVQIQTPNGTLNRDLPKYDAPLVNGTNEPAVPKYKTPLVNGTSETVVPKYNTPLVNGTSELGVKRRLNLEPLHRNSLSVCLLTNDVAKSNTLNGSVNPMESTPTVETIDGLRSATKCSRSLSCDSIVSPSITLSEKSRKYSGATIKVKSTIRKFLRFNSRDDDKAENEVQIPTVPRRRIEIIHPLDLNTSSIEILRPSSAEDTPKTDHDEKEIKTTPTIPCGPPGRPTKPPPPPRTQSLDQRMTSEISKPVRPPPPKSINLRPQPKYECISKTSNNVYENLGESRQAVAPAKPQRASSMRDRARQTATVQNEDVVSLTSERADAPECDRNPQSDVCETPPASSITYCGSETESELYQSVASNTIDSAQTEISDVILESERRKGKSIVHSSLEDNYGAVVIANHETLSQLLEQVNQTTLVPNALKVLQITLHIRFEHFVIIESSKITVGDCHFYNAKWTGHDVVVSISNKPLGPMKSLPSSIALFPLVKFTDIIHSRYLRNDSSIEDVNAYITVWNEQKIESISTFCKKLENVSLSDGGLILTQLTTAFNHLQACGIEDISLDEIFICRRDSDLESKLLLLPIGIDYISNADKNLTKRMSLCKCIPAVLNMLLPKQKISEVVKHILSDERATSLSQAKAVAEYWLWGPCDVTLTNDRQTSLQRWLDLERATFLHKIVCKKSSEINLSEKCHLMFLVRTNAKLLTEASYLLEKQ